MTTTPPASSELLTGSNVVVISERDIVFDCPSCAGELVVDREGAGLQIACPHCHQTLTIPSERQIATTAPPASVPQTPTEVAPASPSFDFAGLTAEQIAQRVSELKHQAKENLSQDTEMRGHINRATIELHRLQLKLKKLQERKGLIEAELGALERAAL